MGGSTLPRMGGTAGGAGLGALLGTLAFPGVGTALGAGLGGGLGGGLSTALTGGSTRGSLVNAALGGLGGYGLGTLGAPFLAGSAPAATPIATGAGVTTTGALPTGAGLSTKAAADWGGLSAALEPIGGSLTKIPATAVGSTAAKAGMLGPNTLSNSLQGVMLASMLSSMLNPPPPQISQGSVSPMRPPQETASTAQFMPSNRQRPPSRFRLG